jgi:vitamin B12 transporter
MNKRKYIVPTNPKSILLPLVFISVCSLAQAQNNTTTVIEGTKVVATKIHQEDSLAYKRQFLDSSLFVQHAFSSIQSILNTNSNLFIKQTNTTGLQTLGMRGGSSNQTAILWNGMPLQMASQSLIDLQLLPNALFANAVIDFGGDAANAGNGAIGGAIHLYSNSKITNSNSITIGTQAGSFQNLNSFAELQKSTNNYSTSLKLIRNYGINNYSFHKEDANRTVAQIENNKNVLKAALLQHNQLLNKNQEFKISIWLQETDRQLAPNLYAFYSKKNNNNFKIWESRVGYSYEELHYNNPSILLANSYYSNRLYSSLFRNCLIKKSLLNIGAEQHILQMNSKQHATNAIQYRTALIVQLSHVFSKYDLNTNLKIRQEIVNQQLIQPSGNLYVSKPLGKYFHSSFNTGFTYRLPSFNDMYWQPGGNPNLKAEYGYNIEMSCSFQKPNPYLRKNSSYDSIQDELIRSDKTIKTEITIYNRNTTNWISWIPSSLSSSIWTPVNIGQVQSRGIETSISKNWYWNIITGKTKISYQYQQSIATQSDANNYFQEGEQLLYTPQHLMQIQSQFEWKKIQFITNIQYVGKRKNAKGSDYYLPYYVLANLSLQRNLEIKKHSILLQCNANNITNEKYQVLAGRPMPWRNYSISAIYQIRHQNKIK